MNRKTLAVALVALVLAVGVVAGALVVGSIHTTDSDFSGASTLDNFTVANGNISLGLGSTGTYSVVADSGDGTTDSTEIFIGDQSTDKPISSGTKIVPNVDGKIQNITVDIGSTFGSSYDPKVDIYIVQESTPDGDHTEGTLVKSSWSPSFSTGEQTVELDTPYSVSSGTSYVIEWNSTNTDSDGSSDRWSINVDESFTSTWYYEGFAQDDGADLSMDISADAETATYISQAHSVSNAEQAFTNLSVVNNMDVTVTWQEKSGGTWSDLRSDGYTTSGNKTVSISPTVDDIRVNITAEKTGSNQDVVVSDEGVQFEPKSPIIDNSSATPQGDITQYSNTFEIGVKDPDFGTSQSDSLTAELFIDGNSQGTDTLASNGTASVTTTLGTGGQHDYHWEVTDDYGVSQDSDTFSFTAPGTFYIRNETNADNLVDNVEVQIRWFDGTIYTNTTNTGKINMTGLDITNYIVQVNASSDYYGRTVYVPSIYEQDSAYLLNKSYTAVETRFTLADTTGEFESNSLITIYRPINRSGTVEYRRVYSDKFGVEGLDTVLQRDTRYRVEVTNPENKTVGIGPYRASTSEVVEVRPGAPEIDLTMSDSGWATGAKQNDDKLIASFVDESNETTTLKIWVSERGNVSNQPFLNKTYTDPHDVTAQWAFSGDQNETQWQVNYEFTHNGTDKTAFEVTGPVRKDAFPLPGNWGTILGLLVLIIFAPMFSILNRAVGAIMIPLVAGMLYWLGFLSGAASAASIIIALGVGMIYSIYISGGP